MKITTVLFDLDGTLLPMDNEKFTRGYFKLLAKTLAPHGYESEQLTNAVWAGTAAMVKNNGSRSNEDAFWEKFAEIYGEKAYSDRHFFDSFYLNEFNDTKSLCKINPAAKETVFKIKSVGMRTVLATNPIFPMTANEARIRWAGLEPSDFELITSYENSRYCKPNPAYYEEITEKLNLQPSECLMVGNDVSEDMAAAKIGMNVFLLTDCLINKEREDISRYPRGSFGQMMEYIKNLNLKQKFKS